MLIGTKYNVGDTVFRWHENRVVEAKIGMVNAFYRGDGDERVQVTYYDDMRKDAFGETDCFPTRRDALLSKLSSLDLKELNIELKPSAEAEERTIEV